MSKVNYLLVVLFLGLQLPILLKGQTTPGGQKGSKVITTAVPFLMIAPDGRSSGMGEVGAAIMDDANAQHWNPAAYAFAEHKTAISLSYSPWLRSLGIPDINLAYLSGYTKLKTGTLSGSMRYFSLGEIQKTDIGGTPIGTEKPNEFALDVGYALPVSDKFSAAIAMRYIHSRLATGTEFVGELKPINTFGGDIAIKWKSEFFINNGTTPVQVAIGSAITNIGPKVSYTSATVDKDFLPINLRLGYQFTFNVDEYNSIAIANDFNKLMVPSTAEGRKTKNLLEGMFGSFTDAPGGFSEEMQEIQISVGAEYWYRKIFSARIGYFYENEDKGNRKFVTVGAGLQYNVFGLDISYLIPIAQNHPLQNTLRFSLVFRFDTPENN